MVKTYTVKVDEAGTRMWFMTRNKKKVLHREACNETE